MTVVLMNYTNQPNALVKTTTTLATLNGTLTHESSIQCPMLLLDGDITMRANSLNYFQLPDFGRYYYVTSLVSQANGLWLMTGAVDVLMSWAPQIRQCRGIVQRQENSYNMYLDDGVFKCYQNPKVSLKKFPSGFTNPSFVLVLAGS